VAGGDTGANYQGRGSVAAGCASAWGAYGRGLADAGDASGLGSGPAAVGGVLGRQPLDQGAAGAGAASSCRLWSDRHWGCFGVLGVCFKGQNRSNRGDCPVW
jgi:hypothetical protein